MILNIVIIKKQKRKYMSYNYESDTMIIGKAPGYNQMVNSTNTDFYNKRLLSGTSRIILEPTGYSFNTNSLINNDTPESRSFFNIGPDISEFDLGITDIPLTSAISLWHDITSSNDNLFDISITNLSKFIILATNESTINESVNNDFGESNIGDFGDIANLMTKTSSIQRSNWLFGKMGQMGSFAQEAGKGISSIAGFTSMGASEVLRMVSSNKYTILSLAAAKVLGISMSLPEVWKSSSYMSNLQLSIKLISPSGHPDDIEHYIERPLKMLLLMGSPITANGILYGFPPLWSVLAEGLNEFKLAAFESIIVMRGGNDTTFNKDNQPLNVDVRVVLKPIINGYGTPVNPEAASLAASGEMMLNNVYDLSKSMKPSNYSTAAKITV